MNITSNSTSVAQALKAARDTRDLAIGAGCLPSTPAVFRRQFQDRPAVLISDTAVWAAAGDAVARAFHAAGHPTLEPFIFRSPDLYAEHRFVEELTEALGRHDAIPVAVGSGTINDLTKLSAHRTGRPYMCVASAASMDGYTAYGASITYQGSKQTFFCPAPAAVVADMDVICAAPGDMNAWGYADLLAKVPAGADWLVADAVGAEPIHPYAWEVVQGRLREMVSDPAGVRARNPAAVQRLMEGLLLGGFAMQAAESSRPASGAEHQFSHLWDMQHHTHLGQAPSHGFKVGIGTLAMTALHEELLRLPLESLDVERCCAAWLEEDGWHDRVRVELGEGHLADTGHQEVKAKYITRDQLRAQLGHVRTLWPELRVRLQKQLLPLATLKEMLTAVGAPTDPEQIGISRNRLRQSYWRAYLIRRRFTALDLAVRTGVLEACLERIFGPAGLWPIAAES